MPELPDIVTYLDALRPRVVNQLLLAVRIISPFLVRSVAPPIEEAEGNLVVDIRRLGKRIVLGLDAATRQAPVATMSLRGEASQPSQSPTLRDGGAPNLFLVFHLMIAGRFRWLMSGAKPPGKIALAVFDFPNGLLAVTEAGTKKRASLHVVCGEAALAEHDPGGLEVLEADDAEFRAVLRSENHTLKRALTDPRLFSGIGNAYSDEILHAARLSPIALTSKLTDEQIGRLFTATRATLAHWIEKLRREFAGRFPGPGEITAFRPDFAVHGRFGKPCPTCGAAVQRIRYAQNETNYCPGCQTEGRILADRSLSRLLKNDWPRTLEELEAQ